MNTFDPLNARPEPFGLDKPEPDATPWCEVCFNDLDCCPGHDDDPEALDCMAAFIRAVREVPPGFPLPLSILREVARCEDYLRKHNPEYLSERF